MQKVHFSYRLLLVLMAFLLISCTCYGMDVGQIGLNAFAALVLGRNPQEIALDCNDFYFRSVSQSPDGTVTLEWRSGFGTLGFFFYHDGLQIHVINVVDDLGEETYRIDWDSLEGSDTVEIEGREVGPAGDVCVIRSSVSRPEPVNSVVPAMICANLALTSPLGGMANGFQSFYWNLLENAVSYRLNFYYDGVLLLSVDAAGDTSMVEVDVSRAAIGGESPLTVELLAFDAAGNQCSQSYSIGREAAPAQAGPQPSATPTCAEDPRRNGC